MNEIIKKTLLIIVLLIYGFNYAQISVTFNVSSRPTPQISEWENRSELAILTIVNSNSSEVGTPFKIKAKIFLDQTLVAETRLQDMPIMEMPYGSETYLADMIIPYNALEIYDDQAQKETIISTGLLPAGFYTFCISLVDLQGNILASTQEICRQMVITDYQMPELIYPIENINIPSNMAPAIIFRWTPLSPAPSGQDGVKYLVAVSKIEAGQTASQAFLSNYPIIEEEVIGVNQMYFPMDVDLPDTGKTRFVWSVKPMMLDDTPYHNENNGFVSLGEFSIGNGDTLYPILDIPVTDLEIIDNNYEEGTLNPEDILHAGKNGEFEIHTSSLNESDGKYSGEGTVYVNWLKARMKVSFNDITVNTNKRLLTGKIIVDTYPTAPTYPKEWALNAVANNPWVNNIASNLTAWVENQGVNIPYNSLNDFVEDVKVPLGINLPSEDKIVISEMIFEPNKSEINLIVAKNTPPSWGEEQLIGFKGSGIDFRTNTIATGANRFEIIEDISVSTNENLHLIFKKGQADSTSHPGCYLEFQNAAFQEVGMEIEVELSRNWVVPFDDDGVSKTKIHLATVAQAWDDMILTGTLPKSTIKGCGGIAIEANEITYDMSDTKNASNITFPDDYQEVTNLYRGFFAKDVLITLPKAWEIRDGVQPDIAVHNMIIDNFGVTLTATANNVFDFKEVSIADLSASVDQIEFDIVTNNLTEASVTGKLALPLSNPDTTNNPLTYTALFQIAQNNSQTDNVQLTVNPGTVNVDLLKGTMNLEDTSNITVYVDKNKKKFDINLNGKYIWDNVNLGNTIGEVSMEMDFENINMHYDTGNSAESLSFGAGSWSFASPAKKMSGFPITIEEISYRHLPRNGALLRGSLDFDVVVNLSENIGGRTTLGIESSINDRRSAGKFRFTPKLDRVNIADVEVHADTPAVKIDGHLAFRNEDDEIYGRGFRSDLEVFFKPVNIRATALVEFGKTDYLNNGQDYRYWRVEADATFPAPGIVFLPGLAFRGFGGGAYKNMEPKINGTKYVFTPKKSGWGLKAKTIIATTPKEEIFNADVDLLAHFSGRNGIERIGLTGAFWLGAGFNERNDAQANGEMIADYNFPEKHFFFGSSISFVNDNVSARNVGFSMDINGRTNKWFIKLGEPTNLNTVHFNDVGDINEYLMVGNDIPTPQGFSNQFRANYAAVVGHEPTYAIGNGGVDSNATTGRGFAFGVNFAFAADGEQQIWQGSSRRPRKVYVYYDVAAGAELNLSLLQYSGSCAGFNPMGINGWRADGGLGMYAKADVGVKAYKKNGKQYKWSPFSIADINVGAWVQGQFPRPAYAAGRLEGHVGILGVKIPFNVGFQTGQQCNAGIPDTGLPIEQQDATEEIDNQLISYINPSNPNNLPVTSPIVVKYAFKPNEVFEIAEQQADGSIKYRKFKLVVSNELQTINIENGNADVISITEETNSLGELLITPTQNQQPYQVPSEMLESLETNFTINDVGVVNMPTGISSTVTQVSSTNPSGITTVYPVVQPIVNYEVPAASSFGNGQAPVGQNIGVPSIGNFNGIGPNMLTDENLFNNEILPIKIMTSENQNSQNKLAYHTLYTFKTTAEMREYKNNNWNTIVFKRIKNKVYLTENDPNVSIHNTTN